jgi:hypothetical protein
MYAKWCVVPHFWGGEGWDLFWQVVFFSLLLGIVGFGYGSS